MFTRVVTRWNSPGPLPGHAVRPSGSGLDERPRSHRRAPRYGITAADRTKPLQGGSVSSRRTPGRSAPRRGPARRHPSTIFGLQNRPGAPSRSPPATRCRTALARAPPTTTSVYEFLQQSHEVRRPHSSTIPAQLDGRLDRTVHYFSIMRRRPIGQNTGCDSRAFQPRTAITSIRSRGQRLTPNQLPDVFNRNRLHLDVLPADEGISPEPSYLCDRSASSTSRSIPACSIVQPSSLVMGKARLPPTRTLQLRVIFL